LKCLLLALLVTAILCGVVFYLQPLWVADQLLRLRLWEHGVKSHYVAVDGYRVHYLEAQPKGGAGIPLVLVHGLGSRGEDWGPMIPGLAAAGFHVYVPDLLGYGRSVRPNVDYSINLEEKLVVDFMETMHLPNADVGGWSMGGWVAAKLALDHPELVQRLVLYDSAGIYFPAPVDVSSLFVPADASALFHLTEMLDPNPKHLPPFVARAAIRKLQRNGWVVRRAVASMTNGRDLLDFRLGELDRPTLIVWGSKDALIPLSVGETMQRLIPHASMDVIEGCGHLAPGQCANSALAGTVEFLQAPRPLAGVARTLPGH
jgi:pimeloyl-ACP methyl ester carboxylesterase